MSGPTSVFALLSGIRALPVVAIDSVEDAVPLADALAEGGMPAIEVTLRTAAAAAAIAKLLKERPKLLIGAGTVVTCAQMKTCAALGVKFAISPGLTPALLEIAHELKMPYLPGTATASDVMVGVQHGFSEFKFFPAEAAGGAAMLKSWAGPFPDIRFCPTGGINAQNARTYMALPNVVMVGSSSTMPAASLKARDWADIARRTRAFTDGLDNIVSC
ncbi:bifunctional 4-hydroxy-2-oxoglutarate aldolase/2-dehydro-3-deoxy-phosphogluconate aldolase [Dongia deserti]|uniref:bifunctional 4-hydroxy-2-oxoglutarate aldolase/2-dehydro-3-deoxy-phosphogluconate aldolase n=1 Tax=Dongia deserti TaxID=2268030 RepID=UPI000E64ED18|nr:bifunctional 4-hydroxy-2-oxoglutarate aldolase/2-dehydro-3-deoxy-phosphogluconate aldolase [Dongia deserti]